MQKFVWGGIFIKIMIKYNLLYFAISKISSNNDNSRNWLQKYIQKVKNQGNENTVWNHSPERNTPNKSIKPLLIPFNLHTKRYYNFSQYVFTHGINLPIAWKFKVENTTFKN